MMKKIRDRIKRRIIFDVCRRQITMPFTFSFKGKSLHYLYYDVIDLRDNIVFLRLTVCRFTNQIEKYNIRHSKARLVKSYGRGMELTFGALKTMQNKKKSIFNSRGSIITQYIQFVFKKFMERRGIHG